MRAHLGKSVLVALAMCAVSAANSVSAAPMYQLTIIEGEQYFNDGLRLQNDGTIYLASFPSSLPIYARDVNSGGLYAGTCYAAYAVNYRGCTFDSALGIVSVIPLAIPASSYSVAYASDAYDINERGDVLGAATSVNYGNTSIGLQVFTVAGELLQLGVNSYWRPSFNDAMEIVGRLYGGPAFYYANGEQFNLEDLVQDLHGYRISHATDILNDGRVAGFGFSAQGTPSAFVLTPLLTVPEPSTLALVALALGSFTVLRRQRRRDSDLHRV